MPGSFAPAITLPGAATDAVRDLRCTLVTTSAATYSDATATANVSLINDWCAQAGTGRDQATLYIPRGVIAINATPGVLAAAISGYAGDAQFRVLPSGVCIICGGGDAYGRNSVTSSTNRRMGGFMWVGGTDEPMIRLGGACNNIHANFYGYSFVGLNDPLPTVDRCRAAIEMVQVTSGDACGHHNISGTMSGFDKAINIPIQNGSGHCDHLYFPRLTFRDCLTDFYSDNEQALSHRFGWLEHYCPLGVQSDIFNYQKGGRLSVDMVSITGTYGCTLLRTNQAASNGGSYVIRDFVVDRALLDATEIGDGYFRLLDHESNSGLRVRISGHMAHSGATLATEDWQNSGGVGDFPTMKLVAPGSVVRSVKLDVTGLDTVTAAAYA